MMQRIALHPELSERIEQELVHALGPVLKSLAREYSKYSENIRVMHNELLHTLEIHSSRAYRCAGAVPHRGPF